MSRHGSHNLSHKNCRNMVFFVATGVLVLYCDDVATGVLVLNCDDVATEVSLSRPRRPRQEVRCRDRAWLWARNFMSRHSILCRDKAWLRPRVFLVTIGYPLVDSVKFRVFGIHA